MHALLTDNKNDQDRTWLTFQDGWMVGRGKTQHPVAVKLNHANTLACSDDALCFTVIESNGRNALGACPRGAPNCFCSTVYYSPRSRAVVHEHRCLTSSGIFEDCNEPTGQMYRVVRIRSRTTRAERATSTTMLGLALVYFCVRFLHPYLHSCFKTKSR